MLAAIFYRLVDQCRFYTEKGEGLFESYEQAFSGEPLSVIRQRDFGGKQVYEELNFYPIRAEIIPMLKKSAEDLDKVFIKITELTDDLGRALAAEKMTPALKIFHLKTEIFSAEAGWHNACIEPTTINS